MARRPSSPFGPEWQLRALIARNSYTNLTATDVARVIDRAFKQIAGEIALESPSLLGDRIRLEALYRRFAELLRESYTRAGTLAADALLAYGEVEAQATAAQLAALKLLGTAGSASGAASAGATAVAVSRLAPLLSVPSRQQVLAAANLPDILRTLDVGGIGFGDWWQRGAVDSLLRVRRTLQTGLVTGQGPLVIARQVWRAEAIAPSGARIARSAVRTIVRTAVTGVQTEAALQEYRQTVGIRRVRFEAILDARTSTICRALDHTEWTLGDPKLPKPPTHPNCRSTLVPIPDETAAGVPPGTLDPGAGRLSYEAWFRAQPSSLQNSILGPARALLFRDGRVTLADLIGQDRRTLTLAQLRASLLPDA